MSTLETESKFHPQFLRIFLCSYPPNVPSEKSEQPFLLCLYFSSAVLAVSILVNLVLIFSGYLTKDEEVIVETNNAVHRDRVRQGEE